MRTNSKQMHQTGLKRAGNPAYADHKPLAKLTEQSAGARRRGDKRIQDFPDVTKSTDFESTGNNWAGSRKGTR